MTNCVLYLEIRSETIDQLKECYNIHREVTCTTVFNGLYRNDEATSLETKNLASHMTNIDKRWEAAARPVG